MTRLQHHEALYEIFAEWTRARTKFEVMKLLGEAGLPCSAVMDTKELHVDPHLTERGFINRIDHPVHGEVPLLGFAPRLSGSDVPVERAPLLGEHTEQIMSTELGLASGDIQALRDEGILG